MNKTFGKELRQFGFAVDSIEDSELSLIQKNIQSYLECIIKAERSEFFLEGVFQGKPAVIPQWNDGDRDGGVLVGEKHKPIGYCGYCLYNHSPLWITAKDEGTLDEPSELIDHWSDSENLPEYTKTNYTGCKTAIIVPIKRVAHVFGLLYIESKEHLLPNAKAMEELLSIAEGYGVLYRMMSASKHRKENTTTALDHMFGQFSGEAEFILTKPSIFFAYPELADPSVISVIKTVLAEYEENFNVIDWKNPSYSGSINQVLIKNITDAKCGVCYFSEPKPDASEDEYEYFDNSNVLIEAGMLHALCANPLAKPENWIPIREQADVAGPIPFDFASDSFVLIERNSEFNSHALIAELKCRMDLLKEKYCN